MMILELFQCQNSLLLNCSAKQLQKQSTSEADEQINLLSLTKTVNLTKDALCHLFYLHSKRGWDDAVIPVSCAVIFLQSKTAGFSWSGLP